MGKYDEARAKQILESAADALAPDLEARRDAARELIRELGHLAGTTRIKTAVADNKARLAIGDNAVMIQFTGMNWELLPEDGAPVTIDLVFDAHEKKFVGDPSKGKDGLAVLLEAAMESMKTRRQAQAVQRSLGGLRDLTRH